MHREYAIDPFSLNSQVSLRALFDYFENNPERLISDLPSKWTRDVYVAINRLEDDGILPVHRKSFKNKLEKLRRNICKNRVVATWNREESWLRYVEKVHAENPFDAILSSNSPENPHSPVYCLDNLHLDSPNFWLEDNQRHVKRTAPEIIGLSLSLLRVSKIVMLVDPYFSFSGAHWHNYRPLLEELFNMNDRINFGQGMRRLEIHNSVKNTNSGGDLGSRVGPLKPRGLTVQRKTWAGEEMHDRFILTDVGGISFGRGLSEFIHSPDEDVLVALLEPGVYKKELAKLQGQPIARDEA